MSINILIHHVTEYPDAIYDFKTALSYIAGETLEQLFTRVKSKVSKYGIASIELREEID